MIVTAKNRIIEGTEAKCEAAILHQVEKELMHGKSPNHIIKRNSDNPNFLKFTSVMLYYPTPEGGSVGAPLIVHPMTSALEAGLEKIAVVGNEDAEWMQGAFSTYHRTKSFSTVNEGPLDELSRSNSVRKGWQGLGELDNELIVDISGDTALVNLRPLIDDTDCLQYDIVLSINVMEIAKSFFPRNPHWAFQYEDGQFYTAKEPNIWLWDLNKLEKNRFGFDIFDMLFNARKFYAKESSLADVLTDIFTREDGKISPKRLNNSLRILGPSGAYELTKFMIRKKLGRPEDERKFARVQSRRAQRLAEYGLGGNISLKIKPCPQPACMMDTDSLEDVIFQQAMIDIDPSVSPHYKKIVEFSQYMGGKWNCEYADNWIEIGNGLFSKYKIPAEYEKNGKIRQEIFTQEQIRGQIGVLKQYQQSLEQKTE
jgi:hypothetical protein